MSAFLKIDHYNKKQRANQIIIDVFKNNLFKKKLKIKTDVNFHHFHPAYVKSNTVVGDAKHTAGVVLAEVVLGNIPVKNGVVHLIHRPLMVVDTTVAKFLEVRKICSKFVTNTFMDIG